MFYTHICIPIHTDTHTNFLALTFQTGKPICEFEVFPLIHYSVSKFMDINLFNNKWWTWKIIYKSNAVSSSLSSTLATALLKNSRASQVWDCLLGTRLMKSISSVLFVLIKIIMRQFPFQTHINKNENNQSRTLNNSFFDLLSLFRLKAIILVTTLKLKTVNLK